MREEGHKLLWIKPLSLEKKRKRKEIEWENGLDSMGNSLGNKKTGHWTLF